MPSYLVILLLLTVTTTTTTAFILQDLPLERFERSGGHGSDEILSHLERHTRSGLVYRPVPNIMARYRYRTYGFSAPKSSLLPTEPYGRARVEAEVVRSSGAVGKRDDFGAEKRMMSG